MKNNNNNETCSYKKMQILSAPKSQEITVSASAINFLSLKVAIQTGLFIAALIIILKIAFTSSHIRTIDEFRIFINKIEKSPPWKSKASNYLPKKGSIFCWVMSAPANHDTKMLAVNNTWLADCDHGEIFTSEPVDNSIPATAIFRNFSNERSELFWKTIYAFNYAFTKISSDFDWYLKADDDSYVFLENLRHYLAKFDPTKPHYLGFRFRPYLKHGYNSGGVYVLSKAAVKLFIEKSYLNETLCSYMEFEDVAMARCLESIGILPIDTRDDKGRQRFTPYDVDQMFAGSLSEELSRIWFMDKPMEGFNAFSPELISLHHLTPSHFRIAHLISHHLKIQQKKKLQHHRRQRN